MVSGLVTSQNDQFLIASGLARESCIMSKSAAVLFDLLIIYLIYLSVGSTISVLGAGAPELLLSSTFSASPRRLETNTLKAAGKFSPVMRSPLTIESKAADLPTMSSDLMVNISRKV